MKVRELIEELQKLPPHNEVKIAYDYGVRMDVEIAKPAMVEGHQVIVITDQEEWDHREHWNGYC